MGVKASLATIEGVCDELLDLANPRGPFPGLGNAPFPINLVAGQILDLPIQRVESFASTLILIVTNVTAALRQFSRDRDNNPQFAAIGGPVLSVASVDQNGNVIQLIAVQRQVFGTTEFYRLQSRAGGAMVVSALSIRLQPI